MITPKEALVLQILDDAPDRLTGSEIVKFAQAYGPININPIRLASRQGLISYTTQKRTGHTVTRKGGYEITDFGAAALLDFERFVRSFLDHPLNIPTDPPRKPA